MKTALILAILMIAIIGTVLVLTRGVNPRSFRGQLVPMPVAVSPTNEFGLAEQKKGGKKGKKRR